MTRDKSLNMTRHTNESIFKCADKIMAESNSPKDKKGIL